MPWENGNLQGIHGTKLLRINEAGGVLNIYIHIQCEFDNARETLRSLGDEVSLLPLA